MMRSLYVVGDWFDADPGSERAGESDWPNWYGPDMIRSILDRRVRHEVGCHTFSHVDTQRPGLEAVFLTLTGRSLRDS